MPHWLLSRGPRLTDKQLHWEAENSLPPQVRHGTSLPVRPWWGPFQPRYQNLNGRWIETSPTLQLAATPIDVAELTEDWDEVMPPDDRELDFTFGGIYDRQAVLDIEEFLQTPRAMTGVAISLARQSIHTGLGALEPGHLFTELEDIKWTLWGQWTDFAETYGGPASITIFSLLCLRLLTWAGGLFCRCVALSKLYKWTTTGLAACFPSFMACLLARQEGSKWKPTKDDRYRRPNMAHNCPAKDWSLLVNLIPSSSTPSRTSTFSPMVPVTSSIQRSWPSLSPSSENRQS
jgi:hypothetical protein